MNMKWIAGAGLLALAIGGCRTAPLPDSQSSRAMGHAVVARRPDVSSDPTENPSGLRQVSFQQGDSSPDNGRLEPQPVSAESPNPPVIVDVVQNDGETITLPELEQLALSTNPAVFQARAELESLRGKLTQAGLPPNPVVGVSGEDINENGRAGKYGVFLGREIVRGNKLGLSRSVVCAEIEAAERRLEVMQHRLLTDVRLRYYELLVAQEKVTVAAELVTVAQQAADASAQLLAAKEAPRTEVLQSQLELQNAQVVRQLAENQRLTARRKLAAFLNEDDLPANRVAGKVDNAVELEEFEQTFDHLINNSPEISALFAEVEQARRQLSRECVEAVPNITWQTSLLFDTVGDNMVAGFQVRMPIPTVNRNQGGIHQARQQIAVAQHSAEKRVLDLRHRLAAGYERYLNAKVQVEAYATGILPKAKETLDLISRGYQAGEVDFLQLLTAQRTFAQTNMAYLESLGMQWQQSIEIHGLLLTGSLD